MHSAPEKVHWTLKSLLVQLNKPHHTWQNKKSTYAPLLDLKVLRLKINPQKLGHQSFHQWKPRMVRKTQGKMKR
jgi:hypothetical protein